MNLLAQRPRCGRCGSTRITPYGRTTTPKDWASFVEENQIDLTEGRHFCPSCQQQTLRFMFEGVFD